MLTPNTWNDLIVTVTDVTVTVYDAFFCFCLLFYQLGDVSSNLRPHKKFANCKFSPLWFCLNKKSLYICSWISANRRKRRLFWGKILWVQSAGVTLRKIEALCSSCVLKPEKFQNVAREHDSFHALAWTLSLSLTLGFSGPQDGEVNTVPRFS